MRDCALGRVFAACPAPVSTHALLLTAATAHAQGTGTLAGMIRDATTGEALIGANVHSEGMALGAATSIGGAFVVRDIPAGRYDVVVSYIGYERLTWTDQTVTADETRHLDAVLMVDEDAEEIWVGYFSLSVGDRSPFPSRTLTGYELACLPIGR